MRVGRIVAYAVGAAKEKIALLPHLGPGKFFHQSAHGRVLEAAFDAEQAPLEMDARMPYRLLE